MLHSEVKIKRTNKGGAAHYMHRLGYAVSLFLIIMNLMASVNFIEIIQYDSADVSRASFATNRPIYLLQLRPTVSYVDLAMQA